MTNRGVGDPKIYISQNLGNREDTILSMINKIEHESEKKERWVFPVGTLALFSYLVSITWSEMGIGIPISYTKELTIERFSDLAEVIP